MTQERTGSSLPLTPLPIPRVSAAASRFALELLCGVSGSLVFLLWMMISLIVVVLGTIAYAGGAMAMRCFSAIAMLRRS